MSTIEERAKALEEAQGNAAHAAGEFLDTYQPDEGEETIQVSRVAFNDLKAAVDEWNAASNAFLSDVGYNEQSGFSVPRHENHHHDPEI